MAKIVLYSAQELMLERLSATISHIYSVLRNYFPVPRKIFPDIFAPKQGVFPVRSLLNCLIWAQNKKASLNFPC